MKSPYRNTDGLPETGEVTVAFSDDRFPVGRTRPTIGLIMSLTSELTTADEATPMTKPMASPITPNVWRKSTNSLTKPFFFSVAFSILSIAWLSEFSLLITATKNLFRVRKPNHPASFSALHYWKASIVSVLWRRKLWFPSPLCRQQLCRDCALGEVEMISDLAWPRKRRKLEHR